MKTTEMYIHLNGLKFYSYHGLLPQENRVGAQYTVNLKLKTDFRQAAETDNLSGTVNYAEIYQAVKQEMDIPSRLLEHLSHRIAARLLSGFPTIAEVNIRLFKQNPPIGSDSDEIGVEATFTR